MVASELNGTLKRSLHKLKKYKQRLNDTSLEKRYKALRHLKRLLGDSKDNEKFARSLLEILDQRAVTDLLVSYNATEERIDKLTFDILYYLERGYRVNFARIAPVVFGKKSKSNYDNLRQLGQTLHTRLTAEQVLDFLDPQMMWHSLLKFSDSPSVARPDRIYDARFILRLLISLLDPGAEMSYRKFIDRNGLSFAFAATSLYSKGDRALAYVVLHRFSKRLSDLTTEMFTERSLYVYVLKIFRNSIDEPNQRIPHVVSHFLARVCKLILHPEDPLYQPILSFLVLKPTLDLYNVPELYKLLLSSSTEHSQKERQWILKLIAESLIDPNDYNILQKRFGIKLCLSFFASCMSDLISRKYVLFILSSALLHPSVAHDLFSRHNLQCWIATTIQEPWVSRWEVNFLCQLFMKLLEYFESDFSKRDKHNKGFSKEVRRKACQLLCKKVLEVLSKEDDQAKALWFDKLNGFLNKDDRNQGIDNI